MKTRANESLQLGINISTVSRWSILTIFVSITHHLFQGKGMEDSGHIEGVVPWNGTYIIDTSSEFKPYFSLVDLRLETISYFSSIVRSQKYYGRLEQTKSTDLASAWICPQSYSACPWDEHWKSSESEPVGLSRRNQSSQHMDRFEFPPFFIPSPISLNSVSRPYHRYIIAGIQISPLLFHIFHW